MGRLYDYCTRIQEHIDAQGLDVFQTRGALALRCGFIITLIDPTDPDDPTKIESLRAAAHEVLALSLD